MDSSLKSLFKSSTISHQCHYSSTQFAHRPLCGYAKEIFTLQLPLPAFGIGNSISLSKKWLLQIMFIV
jgi:hypothetical protein